MNLTVIESTTFSQQLRQLGQPPRVDDAFIAVYWAVSTSPETFDKVHNDIRLLKTRPVNDLPAISVWFRTASPDTVELLFLELTNAHA